LGPTLLVVVLAGITGYIYWVSRQVPRDLGYWLNKAGARRDWSTEAASGKADAQLCVGLNLIRTDLVMMIDRVPGLSSVPLIGPRFFEKTRYSLGDKLPPERLVGSYNWIKKAADQGFAPAVTAAQLFSGRLPIGGVPTNGQKVAPTNASQPPP